jgi:hypothetical protein
MRIGRERHGGAFPPSDHGPQTDPGVCHDAGSVADVSVRAASRVLATAVTLAFAATTGCGVVHRAPRDGLAPNTARFSYGERSVELPLTACGRQGDVVVMGGGRGTDVLQVAADLGSGGRDRTGVTAQVGGDGIFGAFGPDVPHGPAGEITGVRVDGDRLIVDGRWVPMDANYVPTQPATIDGKLVARCPQTKHKD